SFVRTEAVIIAGRRDDCTEQTLVLLYCTQHSGAEYEELSVLVWRFAWVEQVALRRAAERPVDVLARAVDAGERLFVREARHAVLLSHAAERDHDQLLVIVGQVGRLEHRSNFVLSRSHFVVT